MASCSCGMTAAPCAGGLSCQGPPPGGCCVAGNGASCSTDGQCPSGHCIDMHCCGVASCGTCAACTGAGGTCVTQAARHGRATCAPTAAATPCATARRTPTASARRASGRCAWAATSATTAAASTATAATRAVRRPVPGVQRRRLARHVHAGLGRASAAASGVQLERATTRCAPARATSATRRPAPIRRLDDVPVGVHARAAARRRRTSRRRPATATARAPPARRPTAPTTRSSATRPTTAVSPTAPADADCISSDYCSSVGGGTCTAKHANGSSCTAEDCQMTGCAYCTSVPTAWPRGSAARTRPACPTPAPAACRPSSTCTGGTCSGTVTSCNGYQCDSGTNLCKTTCAGDTDCLTELSIATLPATARRTRRAWPPCDATCDCYMINSCNECTGNKACPPSNKC